MSEEKCEFEQIKKVREKDIQDFLIEKLNPDVVNDFMNLIYDYYTHFEQQLQACKEENEKLEERNKHLEQVHKVDTHFCTAFINLKDGLVKILNHYYFTRKEYNLESMCILPAIHKLVARHRSKIDKQKEEIDTLTQQNKQLREALIEIANHEKINGDRIFDYLHLKNIAQQALKGGE